MADSTLGTLSVGIGGNIDPLVAALKEAEQKIQAFSNNINNTITTINNSFARIQVGNNNKGFSRVLQDFTTMVQTLAQIPMQVSAIGKAIGPEVDKLVGSLSKVAPELRNAGGSMKVMANGIDKLATSATKLPQIIQIFQQFNAEMANLGGNTVAGGGVNNVNNAFTNLANNLRGQVNGAFRASHNSLSLLKGGMRGAGEEGSSLIRTLTGLDIPLNKMVGRIVLVNNIWKLWGATLAAWKAGVQTVIDTSQGLANIQAVTLSYGKDFVDIQKKIQLTLRESIFPAKELTDAYVVLGQAGFSSSEATEAFDAVIRLATASMSSLSESANILTTILRTYDLQASDSISVTNQLIAATNLSKLSIEGLNTALNFAGPAAAEAGLALNETLSALSVMADRGIKASTQGTGLRQVLAALLDPSEEFVDKMGQLGIRMEQVNPLLTSFDSILHTLKDAGFSAADAFEVLELRTAGAMNVLVAGADTFDQMASTINESASALTAQLLQQRGLNAELEIFKNRLYEIFLGPESMGKWIEEGIRQLTKLLGLFRDFIDLLRANGKAASAFYGLFGIVAAGAALKGIEHLIIRFNDLRLGIIATGKELKAISDMKFQQMMGSAMMGMGQVPNPSAITSAAGAASGAASVGIGSKIMQFISARGVSGIVGAAGAGMTSMVSGVGEIALVLGTIYTVYQLIQTIMEKWTGSTEKAVDYHEEILKRTEEIAKEEEKRVKYQEQMDKAMQKDKPYQYTLDSGWAIPGQKEFNASLEREREIREELKDLMAQQREEHQRLFREQLPDLLAERQALEDNNLKLKGRYDELERLAAKSQDSYADTSAMLQAQFELEKFLGIQAGTTEEALVQGRIALLDNNAAREKTNKELRQYTHWLSDEIANLREEKDQLSENEQSEKEHAGRLLTISSETKKWTDVLALANQYLGQIPAKLEAFNAGKDQTDKILAKAISDATDSEDPGTQLEGLRETTIASINTLQGMVDETVTEIKAMFHSIPQETVDAYMEADTKGREQFLNDLVKQGVHTRTFLINALSEANLYYYSQIRDSLSYDQGQLRAEREKLAEIEQKIGAIKNTEHEKAMDIAQSNMEKIEDTIQTKSKLVKALELEAETIQTEIKKKQLTEDEREAKSLRLAEIRRQIVADQVAAYRVAITQMELQAAQLENYGNSLSRNPDNTERKKYTDKAAEIRRTKADAEAQLEKLLADSGLKDLDETFDSMDAKTKQIFANTKNITRSLEDQVTLSKQRVKALELQIDLEEGLKDLAINSKQEQEASLRIIELKRKIAQEQYNLAKNGYDQTMRQLTIEQGLLDRHNAERDKPVDQQNRLNMLTQEGYNTAVKNTEEYKRQLEIYLEQLATQDNKLKMLDIEAEKVNKINEAWRDMGRNINDTFAKGLTDLMFGGSQKKFLKDLQNSFIDSFKNVFTETIKMKVPLLDKPLKGNILHLGKFIQDNFGVSFQQGISANPTPGGTNAQGQKAVTGGGLSGLLSGIGSTLSGWASKAGDTLRGWFFGPSTPTNYNTNGVTGVGSSGIPLKEAQNSTNYGMLGSLMGGGTAILNSYLGVGKAKEQATKAEAGLATAASVLSTVAVSLMSTGNIYAIIVGVILEIIALILPLFAPSAFNLFFKSAKKGVTKALLASGGDYLNFGLKGRAATVDDALRKYGYEKLAYQGTQADLPTYINQDTKQPVTVGEVGGGQTDSYFIQQVLQQGLLGANKNNTVDRIKAVSDALTGYYLVLAGGVKHHKAFGFTQAAVNTTLATMLQYGYDLSKLDLGAFFTQLGKKIGSFASALESINKDLEKYAKKKKDFDVDILENSLRGLGLIFAKDFPAGIDVASHAIRLFRQTGKIEMDDLSKSISQTIDGVIQSVKKISEVPIKVVLEGGSSKIALDQLGKQIDDWIKGFFQENILNTISQEVIKQGFMTPIIDQVQFLSEALYKGDITSQRYGESLRSLFQDNLVPNITQFKQIMEDTFGILSSTLGFPLDLLPAFFTSSQQTDASKPGYNQHIGLTFDATLEKRNKTFTTQYLGFTDVANDITHLQDTAKNIHNGPADWMKDRVDPEQAGPLVDSTVADLTVEVIKAGRAQGVSLEGYLDIDLLKKDVYALMFQHIEFKKDYSKTGSPLVININGIKVFGNGGYGFNFIIELRGGNIKINATSGLGAVTYTRANKNDADKAGELFNTAQLARRKVLDQFLIDAKIDIADFNAKAKALYPEVDIMDLTQEQLTAVLAQFNSNIEARIAALMEQIAQMGDDVQKALQDLADQVTSGDEFAAVFSAANQAFAEHFLSQEALDEIIDRATTSLREELPKALNVDDIIASAMQDGKLNVDLLKRLLTFETNAFTTMAEGVQAAIYEALSSNVVADGIALFGRNVKKAVGDSIISALIESITNEVFIGQIFGPFMEGFNTLLKQYKTGDMTLQDILAYIRTELPGLGGAVDAAGQLLNPIVQMIYDIFKDSGFLDAYQNTVKSQQDVANQQLEIAERWAEILKQAREVKSEIMYGTGSSQQIRQQISSAQEDLTKQLAIFRSTSNVTKKQDAASSAIDLIQQLFQLGNSAGEAGLGDYQKTSASFQVFSKTLVGLLDEITNAAITGASQEELLRRQIELLEQIANNTAPITSTSNADASANVAATASLNGYEMLTVAPTDAATENTTVSMINSMVAKLQELQAGMVERIGALLSTQYTNTMQQLIENFAYNGSINITVNGELSAANKLYLSTEIERIVVNSVRRGRIGTEVQRKR